MLLLQGQCVWINNTYVVHIAIEVCNYTYNFPVSRYCLIYLQTLIQKVLSCIACKLILHWKCNDENYVESVILIETFKEGEDFQHMGTAIQLKESFFYINRRYMYIYSVIFHPVKLGSLLYMYQESLVLANFIILLECDYDNSEWNLYLTEWSLYCCLCWCAYVSICREGDRGECGMRGATLPDDIGAYGRFLLSYSRDSSTRDRH